MSRDLDTPLAHRYEQYVSGALPSERHQRFEFDTALDSNDDAAVSAASVDAAPTTGSDRWAGPA